MDIDQRVAKRLGREAGALYLLTVVSGIYGMAYVPSQLSAHGDAALLTRHITEQLGLFRLGIAAELICFVTFLLLPLALYRLLGATHRMAAVLMVMLAVASVPLSLAALAHKLDILTLLGDARWLRDLSATELQTQVMLQLKTYDNAQLLAEVFWGLWLIPLGWLVIRSGQLPRVLGYLLVLGGLCYVVDFAGQLLVAGYANSPWADYVTLPAALGEFGTSLWLALMGARPAQS